MDADTTAQEMDLVLLFFVRVELTLEVTEVAAEVLSFLGGGGTP